MFKQGLFSTILLSIIFANSVKGAVVDSNWIGGEWGFWENNSNWTSANYPHNNGDTYNVTIDGDVNGSTINLQNFHTINQLQCYGAVELEQWSSDWIELAIINGLTNYGELTIRCQIIGDVTNSTGARLDFDKHINIFGNLYNPAGGIIDVDLEDMDIEDANIVNNGLIRSYRHGGLTEPNGLIELLGGTLGATTITQKAGATFEGFGGITGNVIIEPNSVSEPNSMIKLTGPTNIVGDVTIQTGAVLEISDGITLVTGYTTNNGTIHMKGGRLIPQGGITNNGNVIWEPGTYNNVADFNLDGRVSFKDFADFADTWLWQSAL